MSHKLLSSVILLMAFFSSCKKDAVVPENTVPPVEKHPEMIYVNLNDRVVKYGTSALVLDINNDRANDLIFSVLLVGDYINQVDKYKFNVVSSFQTYLPVNVNEQSPALDKNKQIPIADFEGYEWYNVSEITLYEKNIFSTGNVNWLGNWLGVVKKYLPVQIEKDGKRYNGWVELTEDKANERMILHRAAISKESGKSIKAGN